MLFTIQNGPAILGFAKFIHAPPKSLPASGPFLFFLFISLFCVICFYSFKNHFLILNHKINKITKNIELGFLLKLVFLEIN